jgi:hypothetical protein
MALQLEYDKKHVDPITATVLLTRGDDWKLEANVVDRYARYRRDADLTGATASAYFVGDNDAACAFPVVVAVAKCGRLNIDVPASSTSALGLVEFGQPNYVVVESPTLGRQTVRSVQLVQVVDPSFEQY